MSDVDEELETRWFAWRLAHNRRGTRGLLWIVIALYPSFGVLDYLSAPREWLWLLYGTRGLVTAATIAMFWVVPSKLFERHQHAISSAFMVLCSLGISLMTVFMGGLASPYYAGLSLAIVATGLLYVWPAPIVIGTHSTIILSFVAMNLIARSGGDLLTAVSNQFFLVGMAIVAGTGQLLAYRSQREQVKNQLIIERTKKNLELANDELKQLDRFKSEFFANITHELKTPLTMMLSPLELMVDGQLGALSEAQRSTLGSIQKSGVKLERLIGDLLDLSKLEESRLRLRLGEHDLVAYLAALVAQAEPLAQRKALTLRFESEAHSLLVSCDLERVERIFINLLSNATKFTPSEGQITVRLVDEADSVRVDVSDTGVGFASDVAERLFERFYQADTRGTRRFGGTGIGLALAKELVELHGGEIWARGEPERGATFSVRLRKGRAHFLPEALDRRAGRGERLAGNRASDLGLSEWRAGEPDRFRMLDIDQATEQRVVERDADEHARAHSVLVVEDTPDIARVVRLVLHHDFRVLTAPDGNKGFELALKHKPTVIITDLMMPDVDGLELTARLRAEPATRHIPIVMLTARGEAEDRVKGLNTGVNAYLNKPFSAKELLSTVRAQLKTQESAADSLMSNKLDSLQTLAGGLAHQIRNPLNYVKGALSGIQRDVDKLFAEHQRADAAADLAAIHSRTQKLFDTAETGVKRIASTIDLMVRYSRDGYSAEPQPYDVFAAVSDVLALVVPSAGFELCVNKSLSGDGTIVCVPEELNQVLTNLLENAIHALPSDGSGRIDIRGEVDEERLLLSIADNGSGISPEDQSRIWNPFFTTKEVGRGMGLGLTICRRVVDALGGTIALHSAPGAGSEFYLNIPRPRISTHSQRSGSYPHVEEVS